MIDEKIESELSSYTNIIKVVEKRLSVLDPTNVTTIYVWPQTYSSEKAAKGAITNRLNYKKRFGYTDGYFYNYYLCKLVAVNNELTWEMIEVIHK